MSSAKGTFDAQTLSNAAQAMATAAGRLQVAKYDVEGFISSAHGVNQIPGSDAVPKMEQAQQNLAKLRPRFVVYHGQLQERIDLLARMGVKIPAPTNKPKPQQLSAWNRFWTSDGVADVAMGIETERKYADQVHLALDGASLIPVVGEGAEFVNYVLYCGEGDAKNAAISLGGIVTGGAVTEARAAVKAGTTAPKLARAVVVADDGLKAAQHANSVVGALNTGLTAGTQIAHGDVKGATKTLGEAGVGLTISHAKSKQQDDPKTKHAVEEEYQPEADVPAPRVPHTGLEQARAAVQPFQVQKHLTNIGLPHVSETQLERARTAVAFLHTAVSTADKSSNATPSDKTLESHLKAIDLSHEVTVSVLPAGTKLIRYGDPDRRGSFYTAAGTSPDRLGVPDGTARAHTVYEIQHPITVLESTAAPFKDAEGRMSAGGGKQFMVARPSLDNLVEINSNLAASQHTPKILG